MKIALIGASGMLGMGLVDELTGRGHDVTGIVRNPKRLPQKAGLTPLAASVMDVAGMSLALRGHEVVINAFASGHTMELDVYKGSVEAAWRIKRSVKAAGSPYLVQIGGVGSLWTGRGTQVMDDPLWPEWYFNTASPGYLRHLKKMTNLEPFELLAREREEILSQGGDPYRPFTSDVAKAFFAAMGTSHELAQGCRAAFEIFAEDRSFPWTFVSPPWMLMHGPRTGTYQVVVHDLPLVNGTPAGISIPDMALAIADEAEARRLTWEHWSAFTSQR